MPPPPVIKHARHDSAPVTLLSRDHYHLRLATTFIVKSLTPVIRGSSFAQNNKNAEMKRLADERLSRLIRMEKAWGADWVRAAAALANEDGTGGDNAVPVPGTSEARIRSAYVGDKAKERERRAWMDAMQDGILLCFLLNHLFPSQPSHIPRVNISEDGVIRATNVTRFITACTVVGLSERQVFKLLDLQEGSETGLGRVVNTVIALAKLAGPAPAAIGRMRAGATTISGTVATVSSRVSSPAVSPQVSPVNSPPRSPKSLSLAVSLGPDLSKHKIIVPSRTSQTVLDLNGQVTENGVPPNVPPDAPRLQVKTTQVKPLDLDDPAAWRTPTTSTFTIPAQPPALPSIKRSPLPRASTQPSLPSVLRAKSPSVSPSSRPITPVGRVNVHIRPSLRPRHTTGSRVSVTFAAESPPSSPRAHESAKDMSRPHAATSYAHSRERTPSLTRSGYTRSSVAHATITTSDDEANAIDLTEDADDLVTSDQGRERRMSEKKLQEARQRIIGTLLSSEDLLAGLRRASQDTDGAYLPSETEQARATALKDSLEALEGNRIPLLPMRPDASPRHRSSVKRMHGPEVGPVAEEEEASQPSRLSTYSMTSNGEPPRPSVLRRLSSNGRVVIARRSGSPASGLISATDSSFPRTAVMTRTMSHKSYNPIDKAERRQSDGYPARYNRPFHHGRDGTISTEDISRPMQMRVNSMINLSTTDTTERSPSMFSRSSSQNAIRASHQLQVLEFQEPGCPPVKYQLGNCIGRGQFGSVYRSLNLSTGQMVAIKRIKLHGMREDEVTDVMREVELLRRLAHPSIVKYEGMSRDEEYLNIVLEFVENGSLGQTLKAFGVFNERLVASYVAKILEGLDYLHSQGVVHCDLKAANILSTKNGNVKLSDFGVSLNMRAVENIKQDALTAGRNATKKRASEVAGTPNWMAPEVISLTGASFASDIWSLGCTIIELLTGKPPYSDIGNSMSVLFHIVEDEMPPLPGGISDDLADFLKMCFIKDPKSRPAAVVMFEHPWVKVLNPELALRPQDSVPFLRRVSTDLRRQDRTRLFDPTPKEGLGEAKRNRLSLASSHGREGSVVERAHVLIKTSFGKAIPCRICLADVKKVGVLCQDCGLIAHMACADRASPRCDIHEQLALFARQQELQQAEGFIPVRTASPFDNRESHLTALPARIFSGFKRSRSKGGLASSSASQVDLTTETSMRPPPVSTSVPLYPSHLQETKDKAHVSGLPRPSLDTDPSSQSERDDKRSSIWSSITEYDQEITSQRRSGVHFEVGNSLARVVEKSDNDIRAKSPVTARQSLAASAGLSAPVPERRDRGHLRAKDSKSDCLIM
ncbi:hypothetical protein IAU60_002805 [Kwoniella sp. DSM 27419]